MDNTVKTITPKQLASQIGTSSKRVRSVLRSLIPRDTKHSNWQLTSEQTKKIIKAYRTKKAQQNAHIKKELQSG